MQSQGFFKNINIMEFAEILALIKKAIFLVGGACIVILLYYKYGKKKSIGEETRKDNQPKDDTSVVNVRRCEFVDEEGAFSDPSEGIDIDRNESEWLQREDSPVDEFLDGGMSEERRRQMIKDLDDLGYQGSWKNTEENADPFED